MRGVSGFMPHSASWEDGGAGARRPDLMTRGGTAAAAVCELHKKASLWVKMVVCYFTLFLQRLGYYQGRLGFCVPELDDRKQNKCSEIQLP